MNLAVTHGAGLVLGGLVMNWSGGARSRVGMALQAEHVDQAHLQQSRIGRAVRGMAAAAAVGLDRGVLVYIWPLLLGVALEADSVAAGQILGLPQRSRAVRIVAVGTLHQPLFNAVVIGLGEVRLLAGVAAVAQLGLALHQQMLLLLRVVRRVAIEAAHLVARVRRLGKMRLRMAVTMAGQAAGAIFCARVFLEDIDFALVAASGHMICPWPMTTLAALLRVPAVFDQGCFPMRGLRPGVVDIFMTAFARIRADILRSILYRRSGLRLILVVPFAAGRHRRQGPTKNSSQQQRNCTAHLSFGPRHHCLPSHCSLFW